MPFSKGMGILCSSLHEYIHIRLQEFHIIFGVFCCFRWVNSLQTARVTRWGGMISTPDAVLQAVIKRALIDSGSPPHIVNELMENAHERRWPNGLSTLETRQLNRRQYENYVTKRIPGVFDVHFIIVNDFFELFK